MAKIDKHFGPNPKNHGEWEFMGRNYTHPDYKKKEVAKKMSQKGRASLNIPFSKTGKNEGNKMMEGSNEYNRS